MPASPRSLGLVRLAAGIALLAATGAAAQQVGGPDHSIALEGGMLWSGVDDEMASPLRYRGEAPVLVVRYGQSRGEWRLDAFGGGARSRLVSSRTTALSGYEDARWITGGVSLVRRVAGAGPVAVWLGAAASAEGSIRRHQYTRDNWVNYTAALGAVQAAGRLEWLRPGGGRLLAELAAPVVGVALREPYAAVPGEAAELRPGFPPDLLFLRHRLEYRQPVAGGFSAAVSHEVSYLGHPAPEAYGSVAQRLTVSLGWEW